MTNDVDDLRRLRWCCRRGLLELDIVLQRFLDNDFSTLDESQRQAFDDLLKLSDHTLLAYLNKTETPVDPRFRFIVQRLQ